MKSNKFLFAAFACVALTFLLIFLGSYVHTSSAFLECTSWPICFSKSQPLSTNKLYSMLHRIVAFLVVVLNIYLVLNAKLSSFNKDQKKALRIGLVLLVSQSVLGAINVFYSFPTLMSVVHMFLSVAYLLSMVRVITPSPRLEGLNIISYHPVLKDVLSLIIILIFTQFFFGGILNHAGAKGSCGIGEGLSLYCEGVIWPARIDQRVHVLHKLFGMTSFVLILAFIFYQIPFMRKVREKTPIYKSMILGLSFCVVVHFVNIGNLYNIPQINLSNVMHLIYALFILTIIFSLRIWLVSYEVQTYGKELRTKLMDMFELTKPKLGLLVVVTVVSGILLSGKLVDIFYLLSALGLTAMIIASATTLNCYMEAEVDAKMERTRDRALPAGRLSKSIALTQGVVLILTSIPLTAYFVNIDTAVLGFVAFALYLFAYTPMKRKSPLALYVGAIPGAIPPVMGRTIVVGHIDSLGWILFAVLFVWQLPHFMAISIYHNDDYEVGGIKVYSHFWSEKVMKVVMFSLTIVLCVCAILPYYFSGFSKSYLVASWVLNIIFLAQCFLGFFTKDKKSYIAWARQYFWGSIIYLPLLMAAMIFLS